MWSRIRLIIVSTCRGVGGIDIVQVIDGRLGEAVEEVLLDAMVEQWSEEVVYVVDECTSFYSIRSHDSEGG